MEYFALGARSGPLAELKCMARAAFRHEMKFQIENEDQLRSQSMLLKKESLPLTVGGTSGESNISNLWKDRFSEIANSADNRDQVMNALQTVPGHDDVINAHELQQIVRRLKYRKAVAMMGLNLKSISWHLSDC